ncbi:MAG: BNR-4 repeat-containing protein [Candidatus Solibacter usitatus]|nr:BNR-4 repeat-containing protein [Candidatus Solibacter usitatus]
MHRRRFLAFPGVLLAPRPLTRLVPAGTGHAMNTVNCTIFCQPLVSRGGLQYLAWYAPGGELMLARRRLPSTECAVVKTQYSGNIRDAHNGISLGIDGAGVLHLSWDHHAHPLRYARTVEPGSLELSAKVAMDGELETRVTYPEFFPLANGDLLFLYRHGASGRGDTILKRYDVARRQWRTLCAPLIHGGQNRNAYTNRLAIDGRGRWHVSWCWRELGDASTNHDICYARSDDEGATWRKSNGEAYRLPITLETAEVAVAIPMKSELINTGTMAVDSRGRPLISTWWRAPGEKAPQYRLVWNSGSRWETIRIGSRTIDCDLSGAGGARRIPLSRPLLLVDKKDRAHMIFRDDERGGVVSAAEAAPPYLRWTIRDLTTETVGQWEPTGDAALWAAENRLHLFHQRVGQGNAETLEDIPPQTVSVLEVEL